MNTEDILNQRQSTHGEYADAAPVMQGIKRALRSGAGYNALPDIVKESIDMIAHKLGRIVTGNAFTEDHYADIMGYALLIRQRIDDGVGIKPEYVRPIPQNPFEIAAQTTIEISNTTREDARKAYSDALEAINNRSLRSMTVTEDAHEHPLSIRIEPMRAGTPEDGGQHTQEDEIQDKLTIWLTDKDIGRRFRTHNCLEVVLRKNTAGKSDIYPYMSQHGYRYSRTGHVCKTDPGEFDIAELYNIKSRYPE